MSYSTGLFSRAQRVMPGGVNSPVRAFKAVGGQPVYFDRGMGPYLYDTDNKAYIDFVGAFGPLILGHAHPSVVNAVQNAVQKGSSFGGTHPLEIDIAEKITTHLPSLQKIRLVSSGTEATQSAIRLARGFTGRNKILKFEGCYHGHVDSLLVKGGSGLLTFGQPDSAGIPLETTAHTFTLPYNDIQGTQALFEKFGPEIAAVIVEPIAANMNCILPAANFLSSLRTLTQQHNSLLIFDEVITGFRVGLSGAQGKYNILPDLTCLGKIIGGGLPIGAFGGKAEIMDHLSPQGSVYQAGTLSGNILALAAGLATLEILEQPYIYEMLQKNTVDFAQQVKEQAAQHGIPLQIQTETGMFGLFFTEKEILLTFEDVKNCNVKHFNQFFHGMLKQGVYFAPSSFEVGFLSTQHTQAVLDYTIEAAKKVFNTWEESER